MGVATHSILITNTVPGIKHMVDVGLRSLPSEAVLRGQPSVAIEHNGQTYRLQTTRQSKLILTK